MERLFEQKLVDLKQLLLTMAGQVEQQLQLAVRSVIERDSALADQVIRSDAAIDQLEIDIDHRVIELIVRERPMARDLRLVVASIKVAPDLERVADHAVNIAEQALVLNSMPPLKPFITLPSMAQTAVGMVRDAITAFVDGDTALARAVIARDDEVDAGHEDILRELLTYMMEDPRTITRALALLLVSRSLERIADQGTNIAEQVVFMVDGEDIRHQHNGGSGG